MAAKIALSPRKAMLRSVMWTAISAVWLLIVSQKLQRLRLAGGYVSPIRYAIVIFWGVVLAFWAASAVRDWKQMRLQAVGKVS
jgi:hypothetical protein